MEQAIEGLIGPGVTIFGSELPFFRNVLMKQICLAVASGQMFMGLLKVRPCRVLYVAGGRAEYDAFKARVSADVINLDVRAGWPRMGKRFMEVLDQYAKEHAGLGLASLGDYAGIRRELPFTEGNMLAAQELAREKDYQDLRDLRDWSARHRVSVLLGHDLGTKGSLLYPGALKHRDTELRIRQLRGTWHIELAHGSGFLAADAWEMEFDENAKCFRFPASALRKRRSASLPLNENERLIIDTLCNSPPLTFQELRARTGLPYSTLHDRIKAL
jgi:Winged helix-turn-helix DNA-binding